MDGGSRTLSGDMGLVNGQFVGHGARSASCKRITPPLAKGSQPLGGVRGGGVAVEKCYLNLSLSESDWLMLQVTFGGGASGG